MPSSLRSPNLIKKRRKKNFLKILFVLSSVGAILIGPSIITKSDYLEISNIVVEGNSSVKSEDVASTALEQIEGNYFFLFSKKNFALYPKNKIEQNLLSRYKRIKEVELKISRFNTLNIFVEERKPEFIWCNVSDECFFMDDEGVIFDKSPNFSSDIYFIFRGGLDGDPIGQNIFEKEKFLKIISFIDGLELLSLSPSSLKTDGNNLEILVSKNSSLLIRVDDDLERSLSNLESILNDAKLGLVEGGDINFMYLDLRFGNKVFYKKTE